MRGPGRRGLLLWGAIILVLPLGEGGAVPAAQFLLHTLVLCAGVLVLSRRHHEAVTPAFLPQIAGLGLLGLSAVMAASIGSPYPYASFLRFWDLAIALGVFVLVLSRGWGEWDRRALGDLLIASCAAQALLVIGSAAGGRLFPSLAGYGLLNSNHEAAYLNLGILLAAPRILETRGRGRWVRVAALALLLAASVLLGSRGALAGLVAGGGALLAVRWKEVSRRVRLGLTLGLLSAILVLALGVRSRFTSSEDPYRYERIRIWRADIACFLENPWLGAGPGIFRHVAHRFNFPLDGPVRYGRRFETPHSDLLGVLAETGIAGSVCALLFLGIVAVRLASRARIDPAASGPLAALAALAAQGIVEDLTLRPAILLTAAILAGSSIGPREEESVAIPGGRSDSWIPWARLALALTWVLAVLNPYLAYRSDRSMRRSATLPEMERHFAAALSANPYQADTYRFPAAAFLAVNPRPALTLDLYARFRRNLEDGIGRDATSTDLELTRARLERRAFGSILPDAATRDRAIASYRKAALKAPHDPRIRLEFSGFLEEAGFGREALDEIARALAEEPGFISAHLTRARLLYEEGDRVGAGSAWKEANRIAESTLIYRPETGYSKDITRIDPPLFSHLKTLLGPS